MSRPRKLTGAQERILVIQYLMGDPVGLIARVYDVFKSHVRQTARRYGCYGRLEADHNYNLARRYVRRLQRRRAEARS